MTINKLNYLQIHIANFLVHNIASTFSGKRRDQYGVRIYFLVLKLDSEATVVISMFMRSRAIKESSGN